VEDARITITLKGGRDFDAPWLVVKGDTWEEVAATCASIPGFTDHHLSGIPEAILSLQPVGLQGVKAALGATEVPAPAPVPPPVTEAPQVPIQPAPRIKDPGSPATEAQLGLIRKLRGLVPAGGLTKQAAHDYIDQLKASK